MVTIISKQDGPRKGEAEVKDIIKKNRGTIEQIANALSGGAMRPKAEPTAPPQASSTTVSYRKTSSEGDARPYIRISLNGRVVVVDFETGSQLHHLGDIRGKREAARFALATKANGFFAPIDVSLQDKLTGLDGTAVPDAAAEEKLKLDIAELLGFGS